ncbi:MAG: hypothetical protein UX09_C0032G0013 [Candidatus Uhrbacteria bacterium GW2011_GWE2_45_35]|uniref:L,D-TPase catalytic domain-containing protein n=2 Tax=Candidatus Uhriibacteriota TaxID=1752732 RepID=A0A0G1JGD5_9BACT|nr:MAG: hypothetical protein UW63_C0026G0013 [Candidatus Uhrbacteria bacterium GW2011_GWF2_44_350]KKU07280.1 MAG: hypothetical protein UX09_C0032G0013 [Candidatus Uhrbacteria bacterium GW2011_GWE2_45_35]HBR80426.1 hypothetical protein [Candidatus Uhrbacteria bacterium]
MKKLLLTLAISAILFPIVAQANSETLTVKISDSAGTELSSFNIPTANLGGGAAIAVADLGFDGIPEIILGNGLGNEPRVTVLRQDGSEIGNFLAYSADMGTGITLVTCDINQDGINEIVTGTQYGGGPHVRVFNNLGEPVGEGFFAYNEAFRGGINLACGDIDADGKNELVTGPGPSGGPHVRIWSFDNNSWNLKNEFFAFDANDRRGVIPFVKSDGGLVISSAKGSNIDVVSYDDQLKIKKLSTITNNSFGAIDLSEIKDETVLSLLNGQIIDENGLEKLSISSSTGGSKIAVIDLNNDGQDEIISVEARPLFGPDGEQYITVDLSEQRLYAFEDGILANSFLVSTAKLPFTTPMGIHSILAKLPWVDYTWSYSENNPNNYSLGLVPWNLRIYPHVYIHYAYWHNNFGHPMSHGCINVNLENIKWIYDWSEVGTTVEVKK